MRTSSFIEWTDSTLAIKAAERFHVDVEPGVSRCDAASVHPVENVPIILRAIAGTTGRNNVARHSTTTIRHGHDMVPRVGAVVAIRAKPLEVLQDHQLGIGGHRIDASSTGSAPLSSIQPEALVGCVMAAHVGVGARLALPGSDLISGMPEAASGTPSQAEASIHRPLRPRRANARFHAPAIKADGIAPVIAGTVFAKESNASPPTAFVTPLLPSLQAQLIIVEGNTDPHRGELEQANS